jgi:predicted component of type VI protein secretion system
MNPQHIDRLGQELGQAALRTLVRLCPEVRTASEARLEAACAAMRATAKGAVHQLLADAKDAPWLAEMAFTSAVLSVAQAGVAVLRDPPGHTESASLE